MLRTILHSRWLTWLLLALAPLWWAYAWYTGHLFYGELLHATGVWSIRLTMLALAVTPLQRTFGRASWTRWLFERRRYVGVAAFAYAMFHAVIYVTRKKDPSLILAEAAEVGMWTGWVALVLFLALAATSNDRSMRALKAGWKRLHTLVHVAALLVFAHWIITAFDRVPGLVHLAILVLIQAGRLTGKIRGRGAVA